VFKFFAAAAAVLEMDCISEAYCRWVAQIVT